MTTESSPDPVLTGRAADAMDPYPKSSHLWPERGGDWYVLHTRPRQEKKLADDLAARGLSVFLPLLGRSRSYGHRHETVQLPLLPSYLFLKGSREELFDADRTKRVANIIDVPNQEQLAWELHGIHRAVQTPGTTIGELRRFTPGTRVIVVDGPYRGQEGIVETLKNPRELFIQVETLGQAVPMLIESCRVERLDQ